MSAAESAQLEQIEQELERARSRVAAAWRHDAEAAARLEQDLTAQLAALHARARGERARLVAAEPAGLPADAEARSAQQHAARLAAEAPAAAAAEGAAQARVDRDLAQARKGILDAMKREVHQPSTFAQVTDRFNH